MPYPTVSSPPSTLVAWMHSLRVSVIVPAPASVSHPAKGPRRNHTPPAMPATTTTIASAIRIRLPPIFIFDYRMVESSYSHAADGGRRHWHIYRQVSCQSPLAWV